MARIRPKNALERSLLSLWREIRSRPRESWTSDDRNALMALDLYLDPQNSCAGDETVLWNCSDPRVLVAVASAAA